MPRNTSRSGGGRAKVRCRSEEKNAPRWTDEAAVAARQALRVIGHLRGGHDLKRVKGPLAAAMQEPAAFQRWEAALELSDAEVADQQLAKEVFRFYRDHYEDTPYDLTTGISAGPFANPSRWAGVEQPKGEGEAPINMPYGAWERSISIYRTVYTHIAAARY